MPSTYHCDLAWLGGSTAVADVLVEIDDGLVVAVTTGVPRPPDATRLAGLTVPGFANTHSHVFHRALRSRTQTGTGSFWTWREQMYDLAAQLDPDTYHDLARAVFAEMVLAGVTCVGEFHYLHHDPAGRPYADPNAMAVALGAAADEAGLRLTLLDTIYLHGGIGKELEGVQRRCSDGDATAWAERATALADIADGSASMRVGAAVHSVRAVDPRAIASVAAWARARGAPLHAHVSEQPAENEQCQAAFGLTPTELLDAHGALGERFTAVHATHVSARDVELLGRSGSGVCLCPTTEADLGDGIGPALALRDAGVSLSLGTDSHASIDLLAEARAVELHERLATGVRGGHDAASLLRAATTAGHAALGWPEAGRIEPGAIADLVTIRLDSVRTAGAGVGAALEAAMFAASAADVTQVIVGGRLVVDGGVHVTMDVAAELERVVGGL